MRQIQCLNQQVKVIAVFYLSFVLLSTILQIVGNIIISVEIVCENDYGVSAKDNSGAVFLFV